MVAHRRPAGLDRLGQHLADRTRQPFGPDPNDTRRQPPRRYAGPVQRLADVDVAEPGDDALVEQRRLDRRYLPGERTVQITGVETRLQRLGAEPREHRMRALLPPYQVIEQAEAARVVEPNDGAVVEGQHDMVVRLGRCGGRARS